MQIAHLKYLTENPSENTLECELNELEEILQLDLAQLRFLNDENYLKFGVNSLFQADILLNSQELNYFCGNQTMYNQSIYTNFINNFQYIGEFANANPLFIQVI